jgi:Na+/H+-translocating membrane pyrophosphatase
VFAYTSEGYDSVNRSAPVTSTAISYATAYLGGMAVGSSFVCMVTRTAGGIFSEAAGVASHTVGLLERGLEGRSHKNAATVASMVGEHIVNVAGASADSCDSLVSALLAATVLSTTAYEAALPLWLAAAGVFSSLVGPGTIDAQQVELNHVERPTRQQRSKVRRMQQRRLVHAMSRALWVSIMLSIALSGLAIWLMFDTDFSGTFHHTNATQPLFPPSSSPACLPCLYYVVVQIFPSCLRT